MFSSAFHLNREVNNQNYRYSSDVNFHWTSDGHTQSKKELIVWTGVVGDKVIRTIFFKESLTGDTHLQYIQYLIAGLATLFLLFNRTLPDHTTLKNWIEDRE